jgi:hypothetical protein
VQLLWQLRVKKPFFQQRMAVMGNDNIVVGNKTPPANTAPTLPKKPSDAPAVCGAMSQQRDHLGNQSAPQKFVHLVGCRDSGARASAKRSKD